MCRWQVTVWLLSGVYTTKWSPFICKCSNGIKRPHGLPDWVWVWLFGVEHIQMCFGMHACRGLMAHSDFLWSQDRHKRTQSKETPQAPSQEDSITACVAIKMVPLLPCGFLIAISSPQWVPTQAEQVPFYTWPQEKWYNGVNSLYAPDKANLAWLNAGFCLLLVGPRLRCMY